MCAFMLYALNFDNILYVFVKNMCKRLGRSKYSLLL